MRQTLSVVERRQGSARQTGRPVCGGKHGVDRLQDHFCKIYPYPHYEGRCANIVSPLSSSFLAKERNHPLELELIGPLKTSSERTLLPGYGRFGRLAPIAPKYYSRPKDRRRRLASPTWSIYRRSEWSQSHSSAVVAEQDHGLQHPYSRDVPPSAKGTGVAIACLLATPGMLTPWR